MLTEQEVIEALRASNPVPEPERLHRVALETDTLFSSISEKREALLRTPLKSRQPVGPDQHERRRRWYRKPAAVAAALLILSVATAATALYLAVLAPIGVLYALLNRRTGLEEPRVEHQRSRGLGEPRWGPIDHVD